MSFNNDKYKREDKSWPFLESNEQSNLMLLVVKELIQNWDYQKILIQASKKFQIKQYNILNLSPSKALQIYKSLKNKFYSEPKNQLLIDQWCDNELRLFIWLYICYLAIFKKTFDDMTKKDWIQFSLVFNNKTPFLFQYQAKIIKKSNKKSKKWYNQQDQCLSSIIKSQSTLLRSINSYRWSQIAKKLFIESNKKYFRTPKQCRQRWINHLDPQKVKSKWTLLQDCSLIGYVIKQGKKWSQIAKLMNNKRTEHMVKNRYNSLLKTQLKKFEQITDQARVIKKLHYRLKYAYESKNCEKDNKQIEQKDKSMKIQEELDDFSLSQNKLDTNQIRNNFQDDLLNDDLESLQKGNYHFKTFANFLEINQNEGQMNLVKQQQGFFHFQPNYPDFF